MVIISKSESPLSIAPLILCKLLSGEPQWASIYNPQGLKFLKGYSKYFLKYFQERNGFAFFQGALCTPPHQKILAGSKSWPPRWGESQPTLGGTDLSRPSLPTSWQTREALATWYLVQIESVGEVITPVENMVINANLSLRHLKDIKSIGNWIVIDTTMGIGWPRFLRSLWILPWSSKPAIGKMVPHPVLVCGSGGAWLEAHQGLWSHRSMLYQFFRIYIGTLEGVLLSFTFQSIAKC